jgi:hypothetical protein
MNYYRHNMQKAASFFLSGSNLRRLAVTFSFGALILALLSLPAGASVQGDVKAGLPMAKVIDNGLKAGLSPEVVLDQALGAGAGFCDLLRAAVAKKMELTTIYRAFLKKYRSDPTVAGRYSPCTMIRCSVYAGKNLKEVAKAMVKAGATVDEVRACLAEIGCAEADAFAYTPYVPVPPTGPTFPGGGGTSSPAQ